MRLGYEFLFTAAVDIHDKRIAAINDTVAEAAHRSGLPIDFEKSLVYTDNDPIGSGGHERAYTGAEGAGLMADNFIKREIAKQDAMWGVANERADSSHGQLLQAGIAQGVAIAAVTIDGTPREDAFNLARENFYPDGWSGFRDYGSDVANLVVMAAYIRQEIKRRIANGEPTTRTSRDPVTQPYTGDQPATSAA